MEYEKDFIRAFVSRTLQIAEDYNGEYDATLLMNCMLGLLVVPQQKRSRDIPDVHGDDLNDWGISKAVVASIRSCNSVGSQLKLNELVDHLRHAIAHFDVEPTNLSGSVKGFKFSNRKKDFVVEIQLNDLRTFVNRLFHHLYPEENPIPTSP